VIDQVVIACTGVVSIFLTQSQHESRRRYACIFGLAGQPFWVYMTITNQQWGVLVLTVLYTWAWAKGFRTHWMKKKP
jgi:hypothetical protein